jgi:hypothetical protein
MAPNTPDSTDTQDATASRRAGHEASATQVGDQPSLTERLRAQAVSRVSAQKDQALHGLDSLVSAVRHTGQQLRETDQSGIADYVDGAADHVARFSERIEGKDFTEILDDVQRFAQRQPAVFLGVSFGVGLLAARFLKSSRSARPASGSHGRMQRPPSYFNGSTAASVSTARPSSSVATSSSTSPPSGGSEASGTGALPVPTGAGSSGPAISPRRTDGSTAARRTPSTRAVSAPAGGRSPGDR